MIPSTQRWLSCFAFLSRIVVVRQCLSGTEQSAIVIIDSRMLFVTLSFVSCCFSCTSNILSLFSHIDALKTRPFSRWTSASVLRDTLTVKYHSTRSHIANEANETDCFSSPRSSLLMFRNPSLVTSVLALLSVTCSSEVHCNEQVNERTFRSPSIFLSRKPWGK